MQDALAEAGASGGWIVDGNYSKVRDIVWGAADTIVWLDYSLPMIVQRIVRRSVRRSIRREVLWSSRNRETLRNTLFARGSVVAWYISIHRRRRKAYADLASGQWAKLRWIRLRSPGQTRMWVESLRGETTN